MFIISLIIFISILGVLVLVHEFGHFLIAKLNGILVEEFGFGFPPRLLSQKIGETVYSINALPIGGFVKVFGEEYHEASARKMGTKLQHKAFVYKKPWQKTLVVIGGVCMNILLAVIIYYVVLGISGFRSDPIILFDSYNFRFGTQENHVIVVNALKYSAAKQAGIDTGDIILRIKQSDFRNKGEWKVIQSVPQLTKEINKANGTYLFIEIENTKNGKRTIVKTIPIYNEKLGRAIIGVSLANAVTISYQKPEEKLFGGFMHSYNITAYTVNTMKGLFSLSIKEKSLEPVSQTVSGPVGIFKVVDDMVKTSGSKLLINILNTMAMLSLSLAVINILPFPALDGGRLVFIIFEWVTGKRIHHKVEQYVNLTGITILLSLAALITLQDVVRIFVK